MFKRVMSGLLLIVLVLFCAGSISVAAGNDTRYYLGTPANAGDGDGYSEQNPIEEDDYHYGWTLGRFFVKGFTQVDDTDKDCPTFLKNVGDKVALFFNLGQDIDKLNNDEDLSIAEDDGGYDEFFGIKPTYFGRGTLIVRHTDYENKAGDPQIYTNYLSAIAAKGADTQVGLYEEGDYEVALDYRIKKANSILFIPTPGYNDYQIFFRFKIRNGNSMVFPIDVSTGAELTNSSITENGFRLDLAKSHYLKINIKKEVLTSGAEGLVEDTRYNRPAKDGEEYTEEGIYTITAKNPTTNEETSKKIYVGTDSVLKAHVVTGLPIDEIRNQIEQGAVVQEDGTIIPVTQDSTALSSEDIVDKNAENAETAAPVETEKEDKVEEEKPFPFLMVGGIAAAVLIILIIIVLIAKRRIAAQKKEAEKEISAQDKEKKEAEKDGIEQEEE